MAKSEAASRLSRARPLGRKMGRLSDGRRDGQGFDWRLDPCLRLQRRRHVQGILLATIFRQVRDRRYLLAIDFLLFHGSLRPLQTGTFGWPQLVPMATDRGGAGHGVAVAPSGTTVSGGWTAALRAVRPRNGPGGWGAQGAGPRTRPPTSAARDLSSAAAVSSRGHRANVSHWTRCFQDPYSAFISPQPRRLHHRSSSKAWLVPTNGLGVPIIPLASP